jgi:hypothetical protein
MKMNTLYAALCGAFLLGAATLAPAQSTPAGSPITHPIDNAKAATNPEYRADKAKIEADYKTAKASCKTMTGNAKDVCMKQAKGDEKVALADLVAKREGTPHAQYEAQKARADATYEVAQEKCDDMKGADKGACKKQAKADKEKALADAKASRASVASNTTTTTTKSPGK